MLVFVMTTALSFIFEKQGKKLYKTFNVTEMFLVMSKSFKCNYRKIM